MFGQFRVVQSADLDAFGDFVPVGPIHQFQPVAQDVVGAHKIAPNPDRPSDRGDVDRQIFLDFVDDIKGIAAFPIHLITKRQDRQIAQAANLKQLLRLAFDPLCPVNHHDGRINCSQRAVGVFGKVRVSGCVHQIEPVFFEIKRHG